MIAVLLVYGVMLCFISLFVGFQLIHWWHYKREQKRKDELPALSAYPPVTIQLPIYNEKFVICRLLDAVAALQYLPEKLEVQVLDDSNDETTSIVAEWIANYAGDFDFKLIRRPVRKGFKAGALDYGLAEAKGEFIAIFDADFVPNSDYLLNMLPAFSDEKVGVVQARWGHLNRENGLLTEMQAFGLDAHFTVEQVGRNAAGAFINFNGTAGIWRKTCIADAGGWSHDTLTEDLDLSYRAQIKGWNFVYRVEEAVPAELPSNIYALKSQQFRWTKGAAECLRKLWPLLLRSEVSFWQKLNGLVHLSNSFLFLAIFTCAMLSIPAVFIKIHSDAYDDYFTLAGIFISSLFALALIYATAYQRVTGDYKGFWWRFPLFLSVSMGLSLHNAIAVLEGYMGRKSPFVRTPKSGEGQGNKGALLYTKVAISPLTYVELFLSLLFAAAGVYGIVHLEFGLVPFHFMLSLGFFYVSYAALGNLRLKAHGAA